MSSLSLRSYQAGTLDKLRENFAKGIRSQILYLPTGGGKTECAIALLEATKVKGNKAAMLLDRIILCDQTSQRLEKYDIEHGVLQSGHWRYRPYENIQVCSAQTIEKRGSFPGLNLLIIDECFPAGTTISTPAGDKDISIVRCGDVVYNASGVGTVIGVMAKPAVELIELKFEDGTTIECTGNHPIFTDRGWVKASELEVGRISYSIEGLRLLWESVYADDKDGQWQGGGVEHLRSVEASRSLLKVLLEEVEKPNEQLRVSNEDEGQTSGDKASSDSSRRERQIAAASAACFASRLGGRVAGRVGGGNKDATPKNWLSNLLQTGHCQRGDDDWNRVGRWFSLLSGEEGARFQEDRISCFPRLERISRIKRESPTPVFNLHISGHPSYFADGRLVHNCHTTRAQTVEFIKNNPDVKVIGLSATPFTKGLGNIYETVISTITTRELVDQKVLVPLKVFVAKEINMEGAKKVAGEWSQKETTTRGMQITGDIVEEWIKKTHEIFGRPRKTIIFCSGVNHGADLAAKFAGHGYNFIAVSYRDDDQFKKDVIEDFAKPDTEIHGLIATDILTKGFDCVLEGSRVLTDRGLVAVDKLLSSDKIWDGVEYVSHGGAIYKGVKNVITYAGLTATEDHQVKTASGWRAFGECARLGIQIVTTGNGQSPIQEHEGCFQGGLFGKSQDKPPSAEMSVPSLWSDRVGAFVNAVCASMGRMHILRSTPMAGSSMQSPASPMYESITRIVSRLRSKRNSIQLSKPSRSSAMGKRKSWLTKEDINQYSFGQNQQQWSLRSWKFALVNTQRKQLAYAKKQIRRAFSFISGNISGNTVFRQNAEKFDGVWPNGCADYRKISTPIRQTQGHVWDVLNCGPRNRFTCEGLLIHNCADVMIGVSARPFSKSLSSHIQQMGRVMRGCEGKEFAVWLDHCIASGQKVLTHRGLVAIERILISDKIWDGHEFVSHKGVVFRGKRPVITYAGLTATPDHLVKTKDEGWCSLGYCADKQKAIITTGIGRTALWECDDYFTRRYLVGTKTKKIHARSMRVRNLWLSVSYLVSKLTEWKNQGLQTMQPTETGSKLAQCTNGSNDAKMQQPEESTVRKLWWKGNQVQIRFSDFLRSLDSRELGLYFGAQGNGVRSDRQQWSLRNWEYSMGEQASKYQQSQDVKVVSTNAQIQTVTSRSSLCRHFLEITVKCGSYIRANCRKICKAITKTEREVWDILDCGPRNSFTCEGLLVHNSGNYLRFQEDLDDVYANGVHSLDDGREKPKKEKTEGEKKEAKCPKCGNLWSGGSDICSHCGFIRERKNAVVSVNGKLEELKEAVTYGSKQDWWSMCQYKIQSHGWSDGRAAHVYKEKFGVWPKGLMPTPMMPSREFERHVKAGLIRYLKGKGKR